MYDIHYVKYVATCKNVLVYNPSILFITYNDYINKK